jgi:hypothetical protein
MLMPAHPDILIQILPQPAHSRCIYVYKRSKLRGGHALHEIPGWADFVQHILPPARARVSIQYIYIGLAAVRHLCSGHGQ